MSRARAFALLLGVCLALRIVGLVRPCLSDDEATYCVVGRELLAGRVLYRDVVDHKPPLIYLTYAATQAIGGPVGGMRLLHLETALVVLATALVLGRIARRLSRAPDPSDRQRQALAAALLYVAFSTTLLDFDALAANCELYMLLPLTASFLLYLRARQDPSRGWRALLPVGALVGVAMLYKYQAAVQLPLYALHLVAGERARGARLLAPLAGLAALAAGCLAVVGAVVVLMARAHALEAAWFWFRFNFAYIAEGLRPSELAARAAVRVSYGVLPALFLWILGGGAALAALRRPTGSFDRLIAGWLLVSVLAAAVGGRFFGHYFHQITAPLAVLAAPAAARLWSSRRRLVLVGVAGPAVAFFLAGLGRGPVMAAMGAPPPDYRAMAAFVDAHCRPDERLVVWGNAPILYFEADRPLGSRFVFSNYLTGLSPATRTETDPKADASANVVVESWDMFEADLTARRPCLFVDTSPGNIAAYGKFPPRRYPRLQAILDRDYVPVAEVAGARFLALRAR